MERLAISRLTICGIDELPGHCAAGVTHVLSVLDPGWPEIEAFRDFGDVRRTILRFNDIIEPKDGMILPSHEHSAAILRMGAELAWANGTPASGHLLVHCHAGVSRSTAAMLGLLAQAFPEEEEERLFIRLRRIRPQAWPNSLMVRHLDELLGRDGRLVEELGRHYGRQISVDPEVADMMIRLGRRLEVEMAT